MAVPTITFVQSAYPDGLDRTARRVIIYGKLTISSSGTIPKGGLQLNAALAGLLTGSSFIKVIMAYLQSIGGSGFTYNWTTADLWTADMKNTALTAGQCINDSNGNLQVVTTPGTAGNGAEPTWNTVIGGTTTDGGVTWTNQGPSSGLLQIFQGAGSAAPNAEVTGAVPAGVSGDVIAAELEYRAG